MGAVLHLARLTQSATLKWAPRRVTLYPHTPLFSNYHHTPIFRVETGSRTP